MSLKPQFVKCSQQTVFDINGFVIKLVEAELQPAVARI